MNPIVSISHFQQSAEGYCLSACVRMVLTHLGLDRSEAEVSQVLDARKFGTPSFAVRRLIAEGLQVTYGEWSGETILLPPVLGSWGGQALLRPFSLPAW